MLDFRFNSGGRLPEGFAVLVSAAVVVFFCVISIMTATNLGVFTDEAYFAAPAMRLALGLPYYQHAAFAETHGWGPPAIGQYVYAFPLSYLLALSFLVFEPSPEVMRVFYSGAHLATGLVTFLIVRRMFDARSAHFTLWLYLLQPSLYGVTRDSPDTIVQVLLLQLALFALQRERPLIGGFLLGAGVNTKVALLPAAAAMVLAFLIFFRPRRCVRWSALVALGSVVGCAELIVSNLYEPLLRSGVGFVQNELSEISGGGFRRTASSAYVFLSGGAFEFSGIVNANPLSPILVVVALPLLLTMRAPYDRQKAWSYYFAFTVTASCLLFCLLPSKIEPRHFAYVIPWLNTLLGVAFARAECLGRGSGVAAILLLGTTCVWDLSNDVRYAVALQSSGGVGLHSEAMNALASQLSAAKPSRVVLMDWGTKDSLDFLARGRLHILDNFQAAAKLEDLVAENAAGQVFVSTPGTPTRYEIEVQLRAEALRRGLSLRELFRIEGDGRLLVVTYVLTPVISSDVSGKAAPGRKSASISTS